MAWWLLLLLVAMGGGVWGACKGVHSSTSDWEGEESRLCFALSPKQANIVKGLA